MKHVNEKSTFEQERILFDDGWRANVTDMGSGGIVLTYGSLEAVQVRGTSLAVAQQSLAVRLQEVAERMVEHANELERAGYDVH